MALLGRDARPCCAGKARGKTPGSHTMPPAGFFLELAFKIRIFFFLFELFLASVVEYTRVDKQSAGLQDKDAWPGTEQFDFVAVQH